jgi:hypothetical protein
VLCRAEALGALCFVGFAAVKLDQDGTALAAFIVGTALAGGNAVGVRVSNRELDPPWGAGLRFLLAASFSEPSWPS